MPKVEIEYPGLPENVNSRISGREKKKKPKMRVSGKRVFQLKEIKKRKP
jgi:hypothetical protein